MRAWLIADFAAQSGRFLLWLPVMLGLGIWAWFSLKVEPGGAVYLSVALVVVAALGFAVLRGGLARPLLLGLAAIATGFCLAGWRAHNVAGPVLEYRYYGPIEGRVVTIDRSAADRIRLTLDRVRLDVDAPPRRVRVALWAQDPHPVPGIGSRVAVTGHLSPPPEAPEPTGFDFQRHAWFLSLGAVGYARSPALAIAAPEGRALWVDRLRAATNDWVAAHVSADVSGVAAALMTGDRAGIPLPVLEDLRRTNLAHLLAISGLHMGLLTGLVFGGVRVALALIPRVALRWPTRRIAAAVALVAGAGYLAMSGGSIATERAFIMVAIVLGGVLLGRRALTLRAVAVAAVVVLVLRPEALLSAGFQMSFAATTALILVFQEASKHVVIERRDRVARVLHWAGSVFLASLVAGLATAPFAAAHFNHWSSYGLLANMLAVPMMGAVVAPGALAAVLLAPVGLAGVGFWVMELGLRWILGVAAWVAALDGASILIPSPGAVVLPTLCLGALWVAVWSTRWRWVGLAPMAVALGLWATVQRPDVLIAPGGEMVGIKTPVGRALSRETGQGFIADVWQENDGRDLSRAAAFAAWGSAAEMRKIAYYRTEVPSEDACADARILVSTKEVQTGQNCLVLGATELRGAGAIALFATASGWQVRTGRETRGTRLWNSSQVREGDLRLAARITPQTR
ncbi:MAG: ComEC/Rec2 family competence protein [Shimia sp.]